MRMLINQPQIKQEKFVMFILVILYILEYLPMYVFLQNCLWVTGNSYMYMYVH